MDDIKLSGTFRSGTRPIIYRPIANGVYNVNNSLINLYDVTTTQPTTANNYMFYRTLVPNWGFRQYAFTGGIQGGQSLYWSDVIGTAGSTFNSNSLGLTYNQIDSKFYHYQKLHLRLHSQATLSNTKLLTGGIFNLNANVVVANSAYTTGGSPQASIGTALISVLPVYLSDTTSGILLSNACYNRNFYVNGSIFMPLNTVSTGGTFTLYIYLGDDIKSQVSLSCISGERSKTLHINTVIRTTIADVGKTIVFKIRYAGAILTFNGAIQLLIHCRTL